MININDLNNILIDEFCNATFFAKLYLTRPEPSLCARYYVMNLRALTKQPYAVAAHVILLR